MSHLVKIVLFLFCTYTAPTDTYTYDTLFPYTTLFRAGTFAVTGPTRREWTARSAAECACDTGRAEGQVLLRHAVGLHARPSIRLTRLAKSFSATVRLRADSGAPWIDAKSIVRVMALKAPRGATLHFEAEGDDAAVAVAALVALVERDFADDRR